MNEEYLVALFRAFHDNEYSFSDLNCLGIKPFGTEIEKLISHDSWTECECRAAELIRERVNKMSLDEDSPSNIFSVEEHITLFNRVKLLSKETTTEELLSRRRLMNKAIAIQRTHVQGMTVEINERRSRASRKDKEAIIAADKKYQPNLRLDEKVTDEEAKQIRLANEDPFVSMILKSCGPQQRNALLSLIKQVGLQSAKAIFQGSNPAPEPENQSGIEETDESEG